MQPLSLTTAKLDLLREKTSGGSATLGRDAIALSSVIPKDFRVQV